MALNVIPQQEFQKYFLQQWQHHWTKCIAAQAEYFEGGWSWHITWNIADFVHPHSSVTEEMYTLHLVDFLNHVVSPRQNLKFIRV